LKTIKQTYKSPNVCKNGCAGAYYKTVILYSLGKGQNDFVVKPYAVRNATKGHTQYASLKYSSTQYARCGGCTLVPYHKDKKNVYLWNTY